MKIILASGSPRRAKILRDLGVAFEIVKSDAPEVIYPGDPERTVRTNALAKGAAVAARGALPVLSADTVVWFNGKIYGKPCDRAEAQMMLHELAGNTHTVFTGVAFQGAAVVVRSDVTFKALSEAMIDAYIDQVNPLDRAGAYDINACGELLIASYTGTCENIMGLPVEPLRSWGIVD
ncbi:MAG: Maf family protein [Kiritimatiellia bacterium]